MKKNGQFVPARLQAALALLEALRENPSLQLSVHKKPNSSGLISHETLGNAAHRRLNIAPLNKNHGRRSCDIGGWGSKLLKLMEKDGFATDSDIGQCRRIDEFQQSIAEIIRGILEADPIEARVKGKSAEAVIRDVLKQAEEKGKSGDVAQYLVGAKLMIRLNNEIEVVQSNKGDRKSHADAEARTGDYEIGNATIEVAMGPPDEKHVTQIADALEDSEIQVWLLTRHDRVNSWKNELKDTIDPTEMKRVIVSSVEAFVGQNMSEMGQFSTKGIAAEFEKLVELYNRRWIKAVGTPGMLIVIK